MLPHDHFVQSVGGKKFATVLAGPPWRFHNKCWGFEYTPDWNTYSNHSGSKTAATNQLDLLRT